MEGKAPEKNGNLERSFERLQQTIQTHLSDGPHELLTADLPTFLALSSSMESLIMPLKNEMAGPR
jgi:hypothetical protein